MLYLSSTLPNLYTASDKSQADVNITAIPPPKAAKDT
jgi:hypothetical protein